MDFNASKCNVVSVSRIQKPVNFTYSMGTTILKHVTSQNDLGFEVMSTLEWTTHINKVCAKANRTLGIIKRTCGYKAPVQVTKQLFISLVRSRVEYGSVVWSVATRQNLRWLESVQLRATSYIIRADWSESYKSRLLRCKLLPLSYRREILDLVFLYKSLNGHLTLNHQALFPVQDRSRPLR